MSPASFNDHAALLRYGTSIRFIITSIIPARVRSILRGALFCWLGCGRLELHGAGLTRWEAAVDGPRRLPHARLAACLPRSVCLSVPAARPYSLPRGVVVDADPCSRRRGMGRCVRAVLTGLVEGRLAISAG